MLEVVAPEAGTLSEVLAEEGDTVQSSRCWARSVKAAPRAARRRMRKPSPRLSRKAKPRPRRLVVANPTR
ncbi:hypothetical protein [Billgrantia tianxiuensis]|uniref:hypothetical protein n=1 Tax=Billgrantia tianxiuensis TaxID=2497861 RepID=UPI001F2C10FD|nr:hypothetical protein [Halomonas tianxiuensis]